MAPNRLEVHITWDFISQSLRNFLTRVPHIAFVAQTSPPLQAFVRPCTNLVETVLEGVEGKLQFPLGLKLLKGEQ